MVTTNYSLNITDVTDTDTDVTVLDIESNLNIVDPAAKRAIKEIKEVEGGLYSLRLAHDGKDLAALTGDVDTVELVLKKRLTVLRKAEKVAEESASELADEPESQEPQDEVGAETIPSTSDWA